MRESVVPAKFTGEEACVSGRKLQVNQRGPVPLLAASCGKEMEEGFLCALKSSIISVPRLVFFHKLPPMLRAAVVSHVS